MRFQRVSLLAVFVILSLAGSSRAATFTIANGDIAALKSAFTTANGNTQDDTINLAPNGVFTLSAVDNSTFDPTGLPVIGNDGGHALTINGNGATIQRSTAGGIPAFRLLANTGTNTTIDDLTFSNGLVSSSGTYAVGGGLYNAAVLTLTSCTISGSSARYGGGIANDGTLTATDCTIGSNTASGYGGGIYNDNARLSMNGGTLSGNSAASLGGGIFHKSGVATVTGSTFSGNSSTLGGGGIYNYGGEGTTSLSVTSGTFSSNTTSNGRGGGIYNDIASLSVTGSTFTSNNAHNGGGGIESQMGTATVSNSNFVSNIVGDSSTASNGAGIESGTFSGGNVSLTVTNSTFTANMAYHDGGGISSFSTGNANVTLAVTNSTFNGNLANYHGGGISNSVGTATVKGCTFNRNRAVGISGFSDSGQGGALYNYGSVLSATLTLQNSTLFENLGIKGGGVANLSNGGTANLTAQSCTFNANDASTNGGAAYNSTANGGNATISLGNNLLKYGKNAGTSPNLFKDAGAIVSQGFNLYDDNSSGYLTASGDQFKNNLYIVPALQNNGGPTLTCALYPNSPALDNGNAFGLTTDQRGLPRPQNPGGVADVGAFEVTQNAQSGPTFVVNTTADGNDGACTDFNCTLRDAIGAANATSGANTITFAFEVTGTIRLTLGQLIVNGPVTINGPGARILTVSGNSLSRVFLFSTGTSSISGLSISDGMLNGAPGGSVQGGGIENQAILSLADCTLNNHQVYGGAGSGLGGNGGDALGAAIDNSGVLVLTRCTLRDNIVYGGRGSDDPHGAGGTGGDGQGAGIFNATGATLNLNNCTFYNHLGLGGNGGDAKNGGPNGSASIGGDGGDGSGAIFNQGSMNLTTSTFNQNTGFGGSGGLGVSTSVNGITGKGVGGLANNSGATANVRGTIIAANHSINGGEDVDGAFISQGYNLVGKRDGSTGFTATGDQTGTSAAPLDAGLGSLQDNGGPTDTIGLMNGSRAIDQGKALGTTTDQRGKTRPFDFGGTTNAPGGDGSDIGAYELWPALASPCDISISDVTVTEGNSGTANAVFTVTLSNPSTSTVTVQYATGTPSSFPATPGADYIAVPPTTLTFTPGQTSRQITVQVKGDTVDEDTERFAVNLVNAANANIADAEGFCTITDDDTPPKLSINDVTVTEGNSGTTDATFTISLSAASGKNISVKYATAVPGSIPATAGVDYVAVPLTQITFAPGETSKTVPVQIKGDRLDEDVERFVVNLSSALNATIADSEGFCTINDDDAPPTLSINDVTLAEGNSGTTAFTFNVLLSALSSKTVTVKYATAAANSNAATTSIDYTAVPLTTLTFAPGESSKQITVLVKGDTAVENTERFVVKLTGAINAGISDSEGFGTITNDDVAPLLFESDEPSR